MAALLLSLALLATGTYLNRRLEARPTIPGYILSSSGEIVEAEEYPNSAYLPEGPVRSTFQFLCDFTPGGQTVQHIDLPANQPKLELFMAYDAVLFTLATGLGLVLFKRKDLK